MLPRQAYVPAGVGLDPEQLWRWVGIYIDRCTLKSANSFPIHMCHLMCLSHCVRMGSCRGSVLCGFAFSSVWVCRRLLGIGQHDAASSSAIFGF